MAKPEILDNPKIFQNLTPEDQAQALAELMGYGCCDNGKKWALETDKFIANTLDEHPELCSVRDQQGSLILFNAVKYYFPITLAKIIQLDLSPRDNDRLIASYAHSDQPQAYLTDELIKSLSAEDPQVRMIGRKIAHMLIPILTNEDSAALADSFIWEMYEPGSMVIFKKLIDEGFNILIPMPNPPGAITANRLFVETCIAVLKERDELDLRLLLQTQGMIYTEAVLNLISNYSDLYANSTEKAFMHAFLTTIRIIEGGGNLELDEFISQINFLRIYNIDLKESRYYNNKSLERLLAENPNNLRAHIKFLKQLPQLKEHSHTQYTYLVREPRSTLSSQILNPVYRPNGFF